ncbi:hypothetical protein GCM10022280_02000 [Sphingomonas swuensis]|uniref:Uncharacterized protein n=1 Tax=Sphingomonas swuensis TaxID=977800 RepID=A0ABP7S9Z5_9SPHN
MADDEFDGLFEQLNNPFGRLLGGAALLAGFYLLMSPPRKPPLSDAERRARIEAQASKSRRDAARRRAEDDRARERRLARDAAVRDFMKGEGDKLYRAQAELRFGLGEPFADAVLTKRPRDFRVLSFVVTSPSAGSHLDAWWDEADREGGLRLLCDGEQVWSLAFELHGTDLRQRHADGSEPGVRWAPLACRMLAHPDSPFRTITLYRADAPAIRQRIMEQFSATLEGEDGEQA